MKNPSFSVPLVDPQTGIVSDAWGSYLTALSFNTNNQEIFGAAPPIRSAWSQGDICWNINVASGQPEGWRCVASGTPGTWSAMANHP